MDIHNLIFELKVAADVFKNLKSSTDDPREGFFNASHAKLLESAVQRLEEYHEEENHRRLHNLNRRK